MLLIYLISQCKDANVVLTYCGHSLITKIKVGYYNDKYNVYTLYCLFSFTETQSFKNGRYEVRDEC